MTVFDFNIHLYKKGEYEKDDIDLEIDDLKQNFQSYKSHFEDYIDFGNFMLFNDQVLDDKKKIQSFQNEIKSSKINEAVFTCLIDFRRNDLMELLERVNELNIFAIKFHSYVQRIAEPDFKRIIKACKFAEEHNIAICIDTSYGTIYMYDYDNLKLASHIAHYVKDVPIILLHSGGSRVMEAMLIADLQENIYLETSLTLPFYWGSTLIKDVSYIYKKIGIDRVLYASDFPYIKMGKSLDYHKKFFDIHGFNSQEVEKIMYKNALRLING